MCLDLLCYHLTQNVAFEKCTSNLCWIMLDSYGLKDFYSTKFEFDKVWVLLQLWSIWIILTSFRFKTWITWIWHYNICHNYKKEISETTFLLSLDLSKSRFFCVWYVPPITRKWQNHVKKMTILLLPKNWWNQSLFFISLSN